MIRASVHILYMLPTVDITMEAFWQREVRNSGVKTQQHCFEIQVSCANSRLRSFGVKSDAGAGGSLW